MKMSKFLALSNNEKVAVLDQSDGDYNQVTEDRGICSQCGKPVADVGDFCFGCHKLVCPDCTELEPHFSQCF